MRRLLLNLERALRAKDLLAFQLAIDDFFFPDEGVREASRIMATLPPEIQAWWIGDDCDLPHDGSDILKLTAALLERRAQRGRSN